MKFTNAIFGAFSPTFVTYTFDQKSINFRFTMNYEISLSKFLSVVLCLKNPDQKEQLAESGSKLVVIPNT